MSNDESAPSAEQAPPTVQEWLDGDEAPAPPAGEPEAGTQMEPSPPPPLHPPPTTDPADGNVMETPPTLPLASGSGLSPIPGVTAVGRDSSLDLLRSDRPAPAAPDGPLQQCAFCLEQYDLFPFSEACHHRFCNACLDYLRNSGTTICPSCRTPAPTGTSRWSSRTPSSSPSREDFWSEEQQMLRQGKMRCSIHGKWRDPHNLISDGHGSYVCLSDKSCQPSQRNLAKGKGKSPPSWYAAGPVKGKTKGDSKGTLKGKSKGEDDGGAKGYSVSALFPSHGQSSWQPWDPAPSYGSSHGHGQGLQQ